MPRPLRFIPQPGSLVEVTTRTLQSRLLLTPGPLINEIILGVLGRAQLLYGVGCCGFAFWSNHSHILLRVRDAELLAQAMCYINSSNLAREVARLTGWTDKIWSRRYHTVVVSDEEAAQVARLAYILAHGVKENSVGRVLEWPGVHCAAALLDGQPLEGAWFDRTREYGARIRARSISPKRAGRRSGTPLSRGALCAPACTRNT